MRCKIGIVSIGILSKALTREVDFLKLDADFVFSETLMYEGMVLPDELEDADMLISSGYNTKLLRNITSKPIINIEPSLYDILSAYSDAIAYDPQPIIIFPLKQYPDMISRIQSILSVSITADTYNDVAELDSMIAGYKERGCRCIIGSGLVCDEAERFGMHSIFVYPRESLQEYIEMAYSSATALRAKARENKFMSLAIDNSRNGMLFTDEHGIILICNPMARALFADKTPELPIGCSILDLIHDASIRQLYSDSIPVKNVIMDMSDGQYVLSGYPIYFRRSVTNVMLTIDSVHSIQSKERHIRRALSDKGFVAGYHFSNMSSRNAEFNAMLQTAKSFAKHNDNVLILGGTGSGKEVLAQSVHNYSLRASKPFVAVNCSAITETLLESELFGYDEGAFTGAKKGGKPGYFEMAHNGTIFLDEISELGLPLQTKLLRVIQEKQIIRVGGSKVISLDVRIIAATNRDLWKMVCTHQFREDLYYRLAVLELNLPSLCERKEDILPLFLDFIEALNPELGARFMERESELKSLLCAYAWPGNIRELDNFAHMVAIAVSPADPWVKQLAVLSKEITRRCARMGMRVPSPAAKTAAIPTDAMFSETERIKRALLDSEGNYTKAAAILGISRTTLWRKMKAAGLGS